MLVCKDINANTAIESEASNYAQGFLSLNSLEQIISNKREKE